MGMKGSNIFSSGETYTVWGRSDCGDDTMLDDGLAASPYIGKIGGGSNYLCLPTPPSFATQANPAADVQTTVVGVEYSTLNEPLAAVNGGSMPCAHCLSVYSTALMFPGTSQCPNGWETAYTGYLMSARDQDSSALTTQTDAEHFRTEYICVHDNAQSGGTVTGNNEAEIYHVYFDCTSSLSCPASAGNFFGPIRCAVCLAQGPPNPGPGETQPPGGS